MELRDYQNKAIEELRALYRKGTKNVVICLPTGAGKTPLVAWGIIRSAVQAKGNRVLFCAHTQELVDQGARHIASTGVDVGIIMAGRRPNTDAPVQVASIQTLARRELPDVEIVIVDECHHVRSATYERVLRHYQSRGALILGVTATPQRLDGAGLGEFFEAIIEPTTVRELIERGYLSPYKYFAPHTPDMDGIRKIGGDYSKKGMASRMDKPSITGNIVSEYEKHLNGKPTMVFASGIRHSMNIVQEFADRGHAVAHLDGTTPTAKRVEIVEGLKNGSIKVISNVGLFGEGVDVPNLAGVIIARPTQSMTWQRQAVGRALRIFAGKANAIILDMAGNWTRHGMPDDLTDWDLDDREKKPEAPKHKHCPVCYAVCKVAAKECPECGHRFTPKPRKGPEFKDGDLTEIKQKKWTPEMKRALYKALLEEARIRGYRIGWCKRKYKKQTKVWPRGLKDLERDAFKRCQHVRLEANEACRFCGQYCGSDW